MMARLSGIGLPASFKIDAVDGSKTILAAKLN
ncbi:hypothetical protein SAMN05421766_104474 [Zobellia uliginosa]|uniref:Peroxiredoxin n=1 Tax=Zobellia uliginosa TaxID=143224 RepID=A0ABY1KWV1_9FLAO|nr:hypothetical protein SAMN05421766_104474 [Zobellia uliginosa]